MNRKALPKFRPQGQPNFKSPPFGGTDLRSEAWTLSENFMTRAWNTPLFAVATVYFIIDGVFSYFTRPLTAWLSKKKFLVRLRRWVTSLGPYPSLALLAVPLFVLEPAKPLSAYLIATGHFFAGAVVFIAAEVLKLTVVDRLFQLNKKKLLSIAAFAWAYGYWRRMIDVLESTKAWQASRRMVIGAGVWIREFRSRHIRATAGARLQRQLGS